MSGGYDDNLVNVTASSYLVTNSDKKTSTPKHESLKNPGDFHIAQTINKFLINYKVKAEGIF